MAIKVNQRRVLEKLEKYRKDVVAKPDNWSYLEKYGRCLQYLGDPEASTILLRAAQNVRIPPSPEADLTSANLYRLAGEIEQAKEHYKRAYSVLQTRAQEYASDWPTLAVLLDRLAIPSYVLGDEERCLAYVAQLQTKSRRNIWLNTYTFSYLIEARRTQSAVPALEAVQLTEANIRKGRFQPWLEGSHFSPWDAYNEARRVVVELGGDLDVTEEEA